MAEKPDMVGLKTAYDDIASRFEQSATATARAALVREWDTLRRKTETWGALATLHFEQDTTNPEYQQERKLHDELTPKITALDIEMKRLLLKSQHRMELEREFGSHVFARWTVDLSAFDPVIEDDLVREAQLGSDYSALIASAQIEFGGEQFNLAGIESFTKVAEREVRHRAQLARWGFYSKHAEELDTIFDDLVKTRDGMARKLGFENYVALGYKRMQRLDYNEDDVARYREEVETHIVPLAGAIVRERASRLRLQKAMYWDESVHDNLGNPRPAGDYDFLMQQGSATFHAMHPELGAFFDMMVANELMDLRNRPGKNGGGFCTNFSSYGLPFIFANFNGTAHDVVVLLHEMGHAYQNYSSRHLPLFDSLWPTYETAEVHSMSMEFLSFSEMHRFFGDDAGRYREHHLAEALLFIPYGVAVDHFQHLVYAEPHATPAARHEMWKSLERKYLPWRNYGDIAFADDGRLWQEKRHIYLMPFYYIDYTLAQCCALQFWVRAQTDAAGALHDYMGLCARGGTAAFATLIRSANLRSPFGRGALADVATQARRVLGVSFTA